MLWTYADNIATFYSDVEVTLSFPSPLPKIMYLNCNPPSCFTTIGDEYSRGHITGIRTESGCFPPSSLSPLINSISS